MKTSISLRKFKGSFLLLFMAISCVTGCSPNAVQNDCNTLWVVTEQSTTDGMNYQLEKAAKSYEEANSNITVLIDILPTDAAEREVYVEQLRSQIMAGEGPDVYLLPTGSVLTVDSRTKISQTVLTTQLEVEPLFHDVLQVMYSGMFTDINSFYDSDADLHTEALQQDVMAAGVVNGCRYILPLRYTMPILLTNPSNYSDIGINQAMMDSGITNMVAYAIESNDPMMTSGLRMPEDTTLLPQLFDYERGEIIIRQQEIADYMRLYQRMNAFTKNSITQFIATHMDELRIVVDESTHYSFEDSLAAAGINITLNSFNDLYEYGRYGYHWSLEEFPLYSDSLTGALDQAAISKVLGCNLQAQPMRSMDGNVIAEVTYYGAVGSSCKVPELAYKFLRTFLTEDYQWDLVRPRASREDYNPFNLPQEKQIDGLIENSWPVRVDGSAQYMWDTLQYQNFFESYIYENYHAALKSDDLDISNADIPILNCTIDEVRFPIYQPYEETLTYALTLLNHEDGTPTDVDIDQIAEEVWQYLWWHLAEG